ncbi:hypothetical protein [Streptomyces sp. 8N706]|uniref:hypothetical protein n=1 Tax=Streptomyces sp. 8N706 TaxID=3457416 RepID=UPI003FCF7C4C
MRGYVMSRGRPRKADYRFLGAVPDPMWWLDYRDHTDPNYPSLLMRASGGKWQTYLSGIPSQRRDEVGTPIRFSLALEGKCGGNAPGAPDDDVTDRVVGLVQRWLEQYTDGAGLTELGRLLDEQFPSDDEVVELRLRRDREAGDRVQDRVTALLRSVEPRPDGAKALEPDGRKSWFDSPRRAEAVTAFTAHVRALLLGSDGRALVLNLVQGAEEAPSVEPGEALAVLAPEAPRRGLPVPLGEVARRRPPGKRAGRTSRISVGRPRRRTVLLFALPAGVVLAGLVIWYLTHRHTSTP